MSLIITVLGMHRSGTSCLTQLLHRAGMYLGTNLMTDVDRAALDGHFESYDAVHINDRILHLSGGAWDRVPPALCGDDEAAMQIATFLERLCQEPISGWKDPRTTLTFPLWKPHLRDYCIVAALRHPRSVAQSLEVRDGIPVEDGLRLWYAYNARLLRYAEQEPRLYWFDYDRSEDDLLGTFQALCGQWSLRFTSDSLEAFNPLLHHHVHSGAVANPRIDRLYDALRQRARRQAEELSAFKINIATMHRAGEPVDNGRGLAANPSLAPATESADEQEDSRDALTRTIEQLAASCQAANTQLVRLHRAHCAENQVLQRQHQVQAEVLDRQTGLQADIRNLKARVQTDAAQHQTLWQAEFQRQRDSILELQRGIQELERQCHGWCQAMPGIMAMLERLTGQVATLQANQQEQGRQLLECQLFVNRIRCSLILRVRRLLARRLAAWKSATVRFITRLAGLRGRDSLSRLTSGGQVIAQLPHLSSGALVPQNGSHTGQFLGTYAAIARPADE
jgi:hypothetical protein